MELNSSKLSAWNVPSTTKVVPLPIDERVIAKIRFDKKSDKNSMPRCKEYDPRLACDKQVDARSLEELKLKPAACNPNSCFFSFHDAPTEFTVDEEMIYPFGSPMFN